MIQEEWSKLQIADRVYIGYLSGMVLEGTVLCKTTFKVQALRTFCLDKGRGGVWQPLVAPRTYIVDPEQVTLRKEEIIPKIIAAKKLEQKNFNDLYQTALRNLQSATRTMTWATEELEHLNDLKLQNFLENKETYQSPFTGAIV